MKLWNCRTKKSRFLALVSLANILLIFANFCFSISILLMPELTIRIFEVCIGASRLLFYKESSLCTIFQSHILIFKNNRFHQFHLFMFQLTKSWFLYQILWKKISNLRTSEIAEGYITRRLATTKIFFALKLLENFIRRATLSFFLQQILHHLTNFEFYKKILRKTETFV